MVEALERDKVGGEISVVKIKEKIDFFLKMSRYATLYLLHLFGFKSKFAIIYYEKIIQLRGSEMKSVGWNLSYLKKVIVKKISLQVLTV